jgi:hypothetical protein
MAKQLSFVPSLLLFGLLALTAPARANELKMICLDEKTSYVVTFNLQTERFHMTHPRMSDQFKVKRVQNDEDGTLVQVSTPVFGGDREMLALWSAKEKWIRLFYGNGSNVKHSCK